MKTLSRASGALGVALILASGFAAVGARAGGNGNGGNGSGGAHGAATSGMTYHSEPVSSPWNRPPENMAKTKSPDDKSSSTMANSAESSKSAQ